MSPRPIHLQDPILNWPTDQPGQDHPEYIQEQTRLRVEAWIDAERRLYADVKYAEESENRHKLILETQNFGLGREWMVFIGGYLKRAELIGLDTPQGRQALGKAIVTCMHALETAVQYVGPMPKPGVPSGEIEDWT